MGKYKITLEFDSIAELINQIQDELKIYPKFIKAENKPSGETLYPSDIVTVKEFSEHVDYKTARINIDNLKKSTILLPFVFELENNVFEIFYAGNGIAHLKFRKKLDGFDAS